MTKLKVYPYNLYSGGAKQLASLLGVKHVRENSTTYKYRPNHVIINWGNPRTPHWDTGVVKWMNNPFLLAQCSRINVFKAWKEKGVNCPDFTTTLFTATEWLNEGHRVVVRKLLNSSGGKGIEVIEPDELLPEAPLYTKYFRKQKEFRVHVFQDTVIDVQQKKKKAGVEVKSKYIKSHDNGYVFCREGIEEPAELRSFAVAALKATGLDFGALDIAYNTKSNTLCALEVNTAPGIEGKTVELYAQIFKGL